MSTKNPQTYGPLTNKHLRIMAWAAFIVAIGLAVAGISSDSVIMAFLTSAASSFGLVQARNVGEDIVEGRANAGGTDVASGVDVSEI